MYYCMDKTRMKAPLLVRFLVVAVAFLAGSGRADVRADVVLLVNEHVDIGIGFEDDLWDLHIHDETNDADYAPNPGLVNPPDRPDWGLLVVTPRALRIRPAGSQWDFLGVGAGVALWVLPQIEDPQQLFLGIGTEEIPAGTFVDDEVVLALKAVRGPGDFALYQTDAFGEPVVFMASADGITAADRYVSITPSHAHFNWAFTQPGLYEIDFEAFGFLAGGGFTSSGDVTYLFQVQAVPEPATLGLFALGAGALYWRQRRRQSV